MRHLAAYLLLVVGGNATPSADDIKTLLGGLVMIVYRKKLIYIHHYIGTAGIESDEERLSALITELEGKDVAEVSQILSVISINQLT